MGQEHYVIIRDMSAGNERVGDMWQETKVFPKTTTLEEAMKWAMGHYDFNQKIPSRKRIQITRPDNFWENK